MTLAKWLTEIEDQDIRQIAERLQDFDARFRAQKEACLLQVAGADLGYKFEWDQYGPYSRQLARALTSFGDPSKQDEIVSELPRYRFDARGQASLEKVKALYAKPETLGDLPQDQWLEALASLAYLKSISPNPDIRDRLVADLQQLKVHISDTTAAAAWDRLEGHA